MRNITCITALLAGLATSAVQADSITHGSTTLNMDFVNIGYAEDSTGYGTGATTIASARTR